jgi:hypothetical protein
VHQLQISKDALRSVSHALVLDRINVADFFFSATLQAYLEIPHAVGALRNTKNVFSQLHVEVDVASKASVLVTVNHLTNPTNHWKTENLGKWIRPHAQMLKNLEIRKNPLNGCLRILDQIQMTTKRKDATLCSSRAISHLQIFSTPQTRLIC